MVRRTGLGYTPIQMMKSVMQARTAVSRAERSRIPLFSSRVNGPKMTFLYILSM